MPDEEIENVEFHMPDEGIGNLEFLMWMNGREWRGMRNPFDIGMEDGYNLTKKEKETTYQGKIREQGWTD